MTLTPIERYQKDLQQSGFLPDQAQEHAVGKLQVLFDTLLAQQKTKTPVWRRWFFSGPVEPIRGLYFWGGVGRGKTYLMDSFYESLPLENKMRSHFHRFMRRVHHELKSLQDQKNPLDIVAERIAKEAQVICFDEFFVSDITDAMILATLLEGLFQRGVTLVATSNIVPSGLYKDGLQRARFLPAIDLLNQHTEVVNIDGGTDYRLRNLEQAQLYYWPLGKDADQSLYNSFKCLIPDSTEITQDTAIEIEGRDIAVRYYAEDVVWFDFLAVCDGPRSQNDYIELAMEYHTVILSDIPQLDGARDDQARRFINLVDEFYDRGVKLIISAQVAVDQLYIAQRLQFEFERTVSRLLEMQSHEYLARPHKP